MKRHQHDPTTDAIIGCCIEVHRSLGPGLVEAIYEEALCIELRLRSISYVRQVGVPLLYKGHLIGEHRPDLVVENLIVVEVKSVDDIKTVHKVQALTYMRLLRLHVGLLINFNEAVLKDGIRRLVL